MTYLEILKLAAPEAVVVIVALAVLAIDITSMRGLESRVRFAVCGMLACVGCIAAIGWIVVMQPQGEVPGGIFVASPLTGIVKIILLALTVFTVLLVMGQAFNLPFTETENHAPDFQSSSLQHFTTHVGEYISLILMAAAGMMFLVSAEDVLMIFVSLELTSLSLYILTAFNKRNAKSAEAALKYFLFGGMAAAFTLFGLSLLYGLSGSTNLHEIAAAISGAGVSPAKAALAGSLPQNSLDPLLIVALVMTIIGFGFKVAAVPFHLWAPDAYEGAPTPSAAFIASGSKVASFFIAAKVMMIGFHGAEGSAAFGNYASGWIPAIAIVAALSMILGNVTAIVQSNVKRLIAYSAIAHAGYALLGILSNSINGTAALVYYVATYGLTTIGAFGVVSVVENESGDAKLSDFAGLSRRAPLAALSMMVFMLSLAGIPPLAGFFGKFYVFTATMGAAKNIGLLWLVILAVAMSAVSLYYYLQVLKQIFVVDTTNRANASKVPVVTQVVLAVLALLVVLLGCFPNLLLGPLLAAIQAQP